MQGPQEGLMNRLKIRKLNFLKEILLFWFSIPGQKNLRAICLDSEEHLNIQLIHCVQVKRPIESIYLAKTYSFIESHSLVIVIICHNFTSWDFIMQ